MERNKKNTGGASDSNWREACTELQNQSENKSIISFFVQKKENILDEER